MENYSGFDMWLELLHDYGREMATKHANAYLDLPLDKDDHEEYKFRCDLYSAMKTF